MTDNHQGRFHASHVQTAPLKRRVIQYSKMRNFPRSRDHKGIATSQGLGIRTPERGL